MNVLVKRASFTKMKAARLFQSTPMPPQEAVMVLTWSPFLAVMSIQSCPMASKGSIFSASMSMDVNDFIALYKERAVFFTGCCLGRFIRIAQNAVANPLIVTRDSEIFQDLFAAL